MAAVSVSPFGRGGGFIFREAYQAKATRRESKLRGYQRPIGRAVGLPDNWRARTHQIE
jgi:hypothetical protein